MMQSIFKWIRNFFAFSRMETRGFLVLALLLLLLIFAPFFVSKLSKVEDRLQHEADELLLDSLVKQLEQRKIELAIKKEETAAKRFAFDPNSVSIDQMLDLGFPQWLADRLENYRKSGGKFRIKSDMQKLYGFPELLYDELYPFIDLPEELAEKEAVKNIKKQPETSPKKTEEKEVLQAFDINQADTTLLIRLYGVGSATSKRIVNYRDLLGGFIRTEQYNEIYALSDTVLIQLQTLAYIDPDFIPEKISINTATREELQKHPYISPSLARAIVNYREQRGNYTAITDLLKIKIMDDAKFSYLKSYVKL